MQSTLLLPLLPGPIWPGVVAPDRVLSMGQIELFYDSEFSDYCLHLFCYIHNVSADVSSDVSSGLLPVKKAETLWI